MHLVPTLLLVERHDEGYPRNRREIIFTLGQGFCVSCLLFCKQPSSLNFVVALSLGLSARSFPREKWHSPPGGDWLYTIVYVPTLSLDALHCWLLKWQENTEFPSRTCAQQCDKRGSHSVLSCLSSYQCCAPWKQAQPYLSYRHCIQAHHNRTVKMV